MPDDNTLILFCRCTGRELLPEAAASAVRAGLAERYVAFLEVPDLCALVARRDPALTARVAEASRVAVLACHPRAVRWLLHAAGCPVPPDRLTVLDLRARTAEEALAALPPLPETSASAPDPLPAGDGSAWFPVIDGDRCRNCRQCRSFCLFGVYTLSPDGRAMVTNPAACKNNCPACARICPESAIIFPKLPAAEAPLDGDVIGDEERLQAQARVRAQEVLGNDIYAALARRRAEARRRRLVRPQAMLAEQERATHLPLDPKDK